jgi:hypothetical protein
VLFPVEDPEFELFTSGLCGILTAYWALHFIYP